MMYEPQSSVIRLSIRRFPIYKSVALIYFSSHLHYTTMADPYDPYTSYSTPTPGSVGYYPPEEQVRPQYPSRYQQQPYSAADPQPDPNYAYPPQPSPYHLGPEPYQPDRSYTPVGQPDHLGPIAGFPPTSSGKVPENLGYYGAAEQPRYAPSNPHASSSDSNTRENSGEIRQGEQDEDPGSERGIGSSLAGGAAGYYFGHKKDHGLLGALGGAIIGNMLENKVKGHDRPSHGHRHSHGGHHHHHHHGHHSRSRSRGREDDY
ncbi:hypothetical protein PENDEC_c001G03907 [Penicillium decumbens]|uniref:Glycine zipper 2TM domain-containing protein n=1 Tax=Penicillium decumbens TaxID=69771 RepID=A0A1V6PNE4_PENDC|nr:hypothetical protein PENDEC_c001G03907 [Penicillium decumbens]